MRTTVGSLPSAVYWRRRAVVLGAVLLGIIVLFVSCSGSGDDKGDQRGKGASPTSQLPTPAPASATPSSTEPTFLDGVPGGNGPSLPNLSDLESQDPGDDGSSNGTTTGGTGQNTNVTAPADGSCADTEMQLVPSAVPVVFKRGSTVELTLTVKNVGTRTCSRDVGADPQELYIDQGAFQYWSSDKCSTAKGGDVKSFAPGEARAYKVSWNGRQSNTCAGNAPSGPTPPQGKFELRARLGTMRSDPVTLTIQA
ncbi:adhesin [Actinoplanes sp. NPDC026619]|uniref:adhesin n=1 Tax=Actinoplanes sp. NPDC026619 TaxID=3155798 RepID=UPI0033DD41CE